MPKNKWVQEGTPREADDWSEAQDDYGVPVGPAEWDDYSAEQRVPVPKPAATTTDQAPAADPSADTTQPEPLVDAKPLDVPAGASETVSDPAAETSEPHADESVDFREPATGPKSPVEPEPSEPSVSAAVVGAPEPLVASSPAAEPVDQTAAEEVPAAPAAKRDAAVDEPARTDIEVSDAAVDEPPAAASAPEGAVTEPTGDEASTETRQRPLDIDAETFGRPAADAPAPEVAATETSVAAGAASMEGLYRDDDRTQVIDTSAALEAEAAEEERRAEELRLEKEARDQRLGLVATSDANAQRDLNSVRRPGVGGFGSFGLLMLRLVTAFVLGVAAYQILGNVSATADYLGQTALRYPREIAWGLGFTLAVLAVLLVLGLGIRIVGLLLAAIAACSLAFLRWGQFSIFAANMEGFRGDKDLILAAIGILLLSIGGGKVGIDGAISKSRWDAKLAKRS